MKRLIAVAPLLCLLTVVATSAQRGATFTSRLEAVRVDVLVTDAGRIVRGLGAADFEIRDNGVVQQVDLVTFEELPLHVILALDMSDSVTGERLEHLRGAGHAVLAGLTARDRSALVTFSHALAVRETLTGDVERVRAALDDVQPSGDTSLVDGAYAGIMLAPSASGRDLVLVFSDGLDTSSWLTPARVLEAAKRSDATVYGVAVRGAGRSEFLQDLSELTGGKVIDIESTTDLSRIFVGILEEFRQRYLVSYSPRGVSRDGWHRLDVRVKDRRGTVTARSGYQAGG